jgi:hypothetical protein
LGESCTDWPKGALTSPFVKYPKAQNLHWQQAGMKRQPMSTLDVAKGEAEKEEHPRGSLQRKNDGQKTLIKGLSPLW